MSKYGRLATAAAIMAVFGILNGRLFAEDKAATGDKAAAAEVKPQATCPIAGGAIDKKEFADVSGFRVYACCGGCLAKVKADPEAALAKIKANGETPEKAPESAAAGAKKELPACCKPK